MASDFISGCSWPWCASSKKNLPLTWDAEEEKTDLELSDKSRWFWLGNAFSLMVGMASLELVRVGCEAEIHVFETLDSATELLY